MLDRELLETAAVGAVCACLYYDLVDYLDITSDDELLAVIERISTCDCE